MRNSAIVFYILIGVFFGLTIASLPILLFWNFVISPLFTMPGMSLFQAVIACFCYAVFFESEKFWKVITNMYAEYT